MTDRYATPRTHLTKLDLRPPAWTLDALCAQVGGDVWFPEKGESPGPARRICRKCVARADCLEYALSVDVPLHGVWGGTTESDRRRMRRAS